MTEKEIEEITLKKIEELKTKFKRSDSTLVNIINRIGLYWEEKAYISLSDAYETLKWIVRGKPELADDVLKTVQIGLQSKGNDPDSLKRAYETLKWIVQAKPELTDDVLKTFQIGLQSKENRWYTLSDAYKILDRILQAKPELTDDVLKTFQIGLQSKENHWYTLSGAYETLKWIVRGKPELADDVLKTVLIGLQSKGNDPDSLKRAYKALGEIVQAKPKTDENSSLRKLLAEMIRTINKEGGQWNVDLHDKDALKYLEAMEESGLVKFEKHGDNCEIRVDHEMTDDSKAERVTVEPTGRNARQEINDLKQRIEERGVHLKKEKPQAQQAESKGAAKKRVLAILLNRFISDHTGFRKK